MSPGIRKIRMAITSKGRGKSGGARVITYTIVTTQTHIDGYIYLLDIYDKSDYSSVNTDIIQAKITQLDL